MQKYNLTDMGIVVDVVLEEKLSTKTGKNYKVLNLVLATGGELAIYLKPEQNELLAYMAINTDKQNIEVTYN
jgi:hypothetical protein